MLKDFIKKINRKGFFHLVFSNFLVQFLGFGLVIFLGKILPPADIGVIKTVQSYAAFFIVIGTFGYNTSLLKIASERRPIYEKRALLFLSLKKVALFSILSIVLLNLLLYFGYLTNSDKVRFWLEKYSIIILFASFGYIFFSYFQALKKIKKVAKLQAIIRIIFIILIFIFTYFYGLSGLVYSTIGSYIVGTLIYLKSVKYFKIKRKVVKNSEKYNNYAFFAFLSTLLGVFSQNVDIYLLDYLLVDEKTVGFFSICLIFFLSATVINGTVQTIVTPYFSYNENNYEWLRKTLIKYQFLMVPISVVIAIFLYIAAYLLVEYYYGNSYAVVLSILPFLLIKYVCWSTYSITGGALVGLGVLKLPFFVSLILTSFGLLLSYYLYFDYGILGIIYGGITVTIISSITTNYIFFHTIRKKKECY